MYDTNFENTYLNNQFLMTHNLLTRDSIDRSIIHRLYISYSQLIHAARELLKLNNHNRYRKLLRT